MVDNGCCLREQPFVRNADPEQVTVAAPATPLYPAALPRSPALSRWLVLLSWMMARTPACSRRLLLSAPGVRRRELFHVVLITSRRSAGTGWKAQPAS
jgi:hypothetical protein